MDFDPYDPCGMTLEHCHWFGWNVWIPDPNHVIQTASHQDIQVLIVIERLNALLKNAKDFLYLIRYSGMFTFWMLYFGSITNISTSFTSLLVHSTSFDIPRQIRSIYQLITAQILYQYIPRYT